MLFKEENLTESLQVYIDINSTTDMRKHVKKAERDFIAPLLGEALYNEISTAFKNDSLTDDQKELLLFIEAPLAFYALGIALPKLNRSVGNNGVTQSISEKGHYEPVSENTFDLSLYDAYKEADQEADLLLRYLEKSTNKFPLWKESESYTIASELFVPNAAVFTRYVSEVSFWRSTFLQLLPMIRLVERDLIRNILGTTLFDDLKANRGKDDFYKQIWGLCAELVAYETVFQNLEKSSPILLSNRISYPSYTLIKAHQAKDNEKRIKAMAASYQGLSQKRQKELTCYLEASNIPLYTPIESDTKSLGYNLRPGFQQGDGAYYT